MNNSYPRIRAREEVSRFIEPLRRLACVLRIQLAEANHEKEVVSAPLRSLNQGGQLWRAGAPREEKLVRNSLGTRLWKWSQKTASGSSVSHFIQESGKSVLAESNRTRIEDCLFGKVLSLDLLQTLFGAVLRYTCNICTCLSTWRVISFYIPQYHKP